MDENYLRSGLPAPYDLIDISPFAPSGAIYFMDGFSDVRFRLYASGEEIYLQFADKNTSIAASAPKLYDPSLETQDIFLPAPPPLVASARFPYNTPAAYKRTTTFHLMQVISMNMRDTQSPSKLLIGLPYAEQYPSLFFNSNLFEGGVSSAYSYGIVQSLTEYTDPNRGVRDAIDNGYPARSFFAIFHILETPVGTFFNKKATQMELQPASSGKLALKLPPIPFLYALINGPIPLYDVNDPNGPAVGELISAHHRDDDEADMRTDEAWPWNQPSI
jgi:hypothetical protein